MGKFNRKIATLLACVSGISSIGINFNSMAMKNSEIDSLIHNEMPGVKCFTKALYESAVSKGDKIYRLTNGLIVNPDLSCYHVGVDNEPHAIPSWDDDGKEIKENIPFHPLTVEVQQDKAMGPKHEICKLPIKDDNNSCLIITYRAGKIKGVTCDPETGKTIWKELNHENWGQSAQKFSNQLLENEIPTCTDSEVMSKVKELGIGNYSKGVLDYVPLKWLIPFGITCVGAGEIIKHNRTESDTITQNNEQVENQFNDI